MLPQTIRRSIDRIAGHLRHPGFREMSRQATQGHSPGLQMQKEQYVISDQATPGQDFDCEEIRAGQHRHMRLDEIPSRWSSACGAGARP
jgi:hypothetical protein